MGTQGRVILAVGLFLALVAVVVVVIVIAVSVVAGHGLSIGGDRIALLRVEGQIMDTEHEVQLVREYTQDPSVRAIVVRVETPGGAVGASQELYTELLRANEVKPVIVSFGNIAASGGYYVGLAGRRIFANPGTLTGSVGVLFTHVDTSGLLADRLGLDVTEVTGGANKGVGSPWGPLTDHDRELLQGMIDEVHGQFIAAVEQQRGEAIRQALATADGRDPIDVTDEEIHDQIVARCDGRPFTGSQGVEWGFVDQEGTLRDAIDAAALTAGITGEPNVIEYHAPRGLFGPLVQSAASGFATALRREFSAEAPLRYQMPGS